MKKIFVIALMFISVISFGKVKVNSAKISTFKGCHSSGKEYVNDYNQMFDVTYTNIEDEAKRLINCIGFTIGWFNSSDFKTTSVTLFVNDKDYYIGKYLYLVGGYDYSTVEKFDKILKENKNNMTASTYNYFLFRNELRKKANKSVSKILFSENLDIIKEGLFELEDIVKIIIEKDYPVWDLATYWNCITTSYNSFDDEEDLLISIIAPPEPEKVYLKDIEL